MVDSDELLNMFLNFLEEKGWREMNCDEYVSKFPRREGGWKEMICNEYISRFPRRGGGEGDELMNIFLDFLEEDGVEGDE